MEPRPAANSLPEEDILRADMYGFLARILLAKPGPEDLSRIAALDGDGTELGQAISGLAEVARTLGPKAISTEYDGLFIGLGRGELVPYGSYYLTGFLNEKPLAKLRQAMRELGIRRRDEVKEPEDHIGSLMEMMAGLILGSYGAPAGHTTQRTFFEDHIDPWAGHFFNDLERAELARFYRPVGRIGHTLVGIERSAFAM